MTVTDVWWMFILLMAKHTVADFPLQPRYMWANKGTYGHLGGIVHALVHGVLTVGVLVEWMSFAASCTLGLVDAVVHYHVDWAKMNINKKLGWTATTHEQFWWLVGVDQFLHFMTYAALVHYCMNH